ncbi:response regulator transcription factor [Arcobacter vandammei]|uniref:response regulator transcription factor n=1 Tax=Arcobacter vandammei TaxID=2782243 RepID=UPI0018DFF047|nr:response regulator transcription factor [Arcobacter vandammei]
MKNKTILIIEDEEDLLELLEFTLQKEDFETIGFLSINENIKKILDEEKIDLILMDRNLPNIEGTTYIKELRNSGYQNPVIYLTAKDKQSDILDGFEAYADDYITKPFNINELIARVKAVIKRSNKECETLKVRDILYNFSNKSFSIDDKTLELTQLETNLLLEFIKNQNILLSREYLLENIWKDSLDKQEKTVNVAIKRLKDKIDLKGEKNYIKAIRGEGYIFC